MQKYIDHNKNNELINFDNLREENPEYFNYNDGQYDNDDSSSSSSSDSNKEN